MPKVFIFIHTKSIGGAERRFSGLWKSLQEISFDAHLVLQNSLLQKLILDKKFAAVVENNRQKIHELQVEPGEKLKSAYQRFVSKNCNGDDVLHFVGEHPFFSSRQKQLFSITQSSLKNLNIFGKTGHLLGCFLSDQIDIIDPKIYSTFRKLFFYKKDSVTLTKCSYCEADSFVSISYSEKKNWIVFLGRFEEMKQVLPVVKALPQIHSELKSLHIEDVQYHLLGYGNQEEEIKKLVAQKEYADIPVHVKYTDEPGNILKYSKVFLSLQRHNNYPSRSLIEAMAAGNIPLVTDNGETRWLAKPQFSYYVPENFSAQHLVAELKKIFRESEAVLAEKSRLAQQTIKNEHTIEKMRSYYLNLYQKLSN